MIISTASISGIILAKKVAKSTVIYSKNNTDVIIDENNEVIETYNSQDNIIEEKDENKSENTENRSIRENKPSTDNSSDIDLCLLGEIMMGGEVSQKLSYSYAAAFKNVYNLTRSADFTYANFSTNITNLNQIENPKSKYIVTKDILNAIKALGIDSVSIASDHIIDFPSDIIKNTINMFEKEKIFVAGRENMPVYFQKGDKKIAIVSTNAIINGTSSLYKDEGISTYTKENLIKNIKEAKSSADVVIVDIHWGKEYEYGITDQMKDITDVASSNGADLVIGSHALGVYPIVKYNDVPVIFSLGYFISDSDLYLGKESYIFNIKISSEGKIDQIDMTPIYINDKKEVLLYNEYDEEKTKEVLEQYNNWNVENGLESKIEDNKIKIKL